METRSAHKKIHNSRSNKPLVDPAGLATRHRFSVETGDLLWLDGHWYVTHSGLIRLAGETTALASMSNQFQSSQIHRLQDGYSKLQFTNLEPAGASSVTVTPIRRMSPPLSVAQRCAWPRPEPSIAPSARPTASASARSKRSEQFRSRAKKLPPQNANGNGNGGGPKVRDRLCQIIRQHQLDPNLVKAYATDFCGTKTLREATREQVENFVQQLADWAEKDRNALLCQLNSYLGQKKVPHETPNRWLARRGSRPRRPNSRRILPRSRATSPFSPATAKALLHAQLWPSLSRAVLRVMSFPAASIATPKPCGS